jgi:hypothetical protein
MLFILFFSDFFFSFVSFSCFFIFLYLFSYYFFYRIFLSLLYLYFYPFLSFFSSSSFLFIFPFQGWGGMMECFLFIIFNFNLYFLSNIIFHVSFFFLSFILLYFISISCIIYCFSFISPFPSNYLLSIFIFSYLHLFFIYCFPFNIFLSVGISLFEMT